MASDHKFERYVDREAVLEDEKNRIIDFKQFELLPPEVGIYDEPVRYFKANKEWCKFIFGWIAWMQSPAFWRLAEDQQYHAIQQMLIFEEGIDFGILMDPETFENGIYNAIYRAVNDVSKQIVSGRKTGITVDDEGNVVESPAGDASDIPDDPTTPQDEGLEARSGEAIALANGYNGMIIKLLELYGPDATEDMPLAQAQFIMKSIYISNDAQMDAAVAHYWAYRATLVVPFLVLDVDALAQEFFCSDLSIAVVMEYIFSLVEPFEEKQIVGEVWGSLEIEQSNIWVKAGQKVPSTEYLAYHCTAVRPETFQLNMASTEIPAYATNAIHKHGHRIRIEVSGSFTDSDNPGLVQDFFYEHNTTTGVKTFVPSRFIIQSGALIAAEPAQADVPFEPSHSYRITMDLTDNPFADGPITFGRDNAPFNLPNTTGILSFTITDLGEYLV